MKVLKTKTISVNATLLSFSYSTLLGFNLLHMSWIKWNSFLVHNETVDFIGCWFYATVKDNVLNCILALLETEIAMYAIIVTIDISITKSSCSFTILLSSNYHKSMV